MGEADPANKLLAEAYSEYHSHIYRFLLRRTGDHHEADELTARVFADAAESLKAARKKPDSMLAWLYTVAERRFIDEVRRRETARRRLTHLNSTSTSNPFYGRQVARTLKAAIERLPYEQRAVVVGKVIQGKAFVEIANELGISVDACKMRLSRAVARLRVELDQQGLREDDG
jgi:RNA polymerase sigma-70 factor (ECF subfamily)